MSETIRLIRAIQRLWAMGRGPRRATAVACPAPNAPPAQRATTGRTQPRQNQAVSPPTEAGYKISKTSTLVYFCLPLSTFCLPCSPLPRLFRRQSAFISFLLALGSLPSRHANTLPPIPDGRPHLPHQSLPILLFPPPPSSDSFFGRSHFHQCFAGSRSRGLVVRGCQSLSMVCSEPPASFVSHYQPVSMFGSGASASFPDLPLFTNVSLCPAASCPASSHSRIYQSLPMSRFAPALPSCPLHPIQRIYQSLPMSCSTRHLRPFTRTSSLFQCFPSTLPSL
jgi:hypothetical protein